jgi:hypothetical protein
MGSWLLKTSHFDPNERRRTNHGPDKTGKCLRKVIDKRAQGWALEWLPYTILCIANS